MNIYRTYCILLLWLYLLQPVSAQEYWQHIDNLPCEETTSIAQDSEGFMWFGTRLALVRYDGYNMKQYRNDMDRPHGFSSCDIRSLCADDNGHVYAGSFFGLNIYSCSTRQITSRHFKANDFIGALCMDGHTLWVGTSRGLYRIGKQARCYRQGGLSNLSIRDIVRLPGGGVAVTATDGVYRITADGRLCTRLRGTENIGPTTATVVDGGKIIIGTQGKGLYLYDGKRLQAMENIRCAAVRSLLYSNKRRCLYVGTENGVVALGQDGRLTTHMAGKGVARLFEDHAGNLWAATDGEGIWLNRYGGVPFRTKRPSFLRNTCALMSQLAIRHQPDTALLAHHRDINCLYEASDGRLFVGTLTDGTYIYRNGRLERHLLAGRTPWLHHNDCYALAELPSGRMLMASWSGLYLVTPDMQHGQLVRHIGTTDIWQTHILTMNRTSDRELWLGLVGGIVRVTFRDDDLRRARLTLYTKVGMRGVRQPARLSALTDSHSAYGPYQIGGIYRIVDDSAGRIWATTSEPGLLLYDAKTDAFQSVSARYGIRGDNVHSMDVDRNNDFWLTTNYGIMQLRLNKEGDVAFQRLYTQYDGLPTHYFGNAISTRLDDGTVCIVNRHLLVRVSPTGRNRQAGRRTAITDVVAGGESVCFQKTDGWFRLSHRQNTISVAFSTFDYGNESSVRYCYKLDGVDDSVQMTDMGDNLIRYNHLSPGEYVLHYGVYEPGQGNWGVVQTVTFEIVQPWWWRWWAKAAYAIALVALVVAVVRNRSKHRRIRLQLEKSAWEKRQLNEQYNKMVQFYTRVIHEFMTPVTLISGLAHDLQKRVRPALQASAYMMASQTDKLIDTLDQLGQSEDDRAMQEAVGKAREMAMTDKEFLRKCTESVNNHIADENYTHRDMMDEVGASHATLYRKLKMLTGKDSTSFIRGIRMKAACQILTENPSIRIGELAARVGYSNPKYFSTCFKKDIGVSPREYLGRETRLEGEDQG